MPTLIIHDDDLKDPKKPPKSLEDMKCSAGGSPLVVLHISGSKTTVLYGPEDIK